METITITYPGDSATRFDRNYYAAHHLPLVLKSWERYGLQRLAAFYPEAEGSGFVAICVCLFRDNAAVAASFGSPEAQQVMEDVHHFTDSTPVQRRSVPL